MTKKIRMTKQKKIILELLRETTSHPTADWVYEQAKKEIPELSLGTVYRNLNVLKNMGEIAELNYGSSYSRYDGNLETHYHFTCEECKTVFDIEIPLNKEMEKLVEETTGHKALTHRLEFYGTCKDCKKTS